MSETQANEIHPAHDPKVDIKETSFRFRKQKDEQSGVETKRPDVVLKLAVPSVEGIVDILQTGGKGLEFLQAVIEAAVQDKARSLLNDNANMTADDFPYAQCLWDAIANEPESERRGRGIPKEIWEEFLADWIAVMPGLGGKSPEQVANQAKMLGQKLQPLKTHEKKEVILPAFRTQLALYASNSPNAENFVGCIEFLNKKIDQFLTADENSNLEQNLGF